MTPPLSVSRLLVSVRNLAEARSAFAGGAEVIDIKEPTHGSLGRAEYGEIQEIVAHFSTCDSQVPLSAALGEVTDVNCRTPLSLPRRLSFAKLGLSGLRERSNWVDDWLVIRRGFESHHGTGLDWVAVAYADAEQAQAPPPRAVLSAAIETGCAGLLIDTYDKHSGRLLEMMSIPALADLAESAQKRGLFFAVAGRLRMQDIPALRPVDPDIIAVRSAACDDDDRQGRVCPQRVRELREMIAQSLSEVGGGPCSANLTTNR